MADERRRRLERQAAQGDADAQNQLIAERVRSGELDRDRVALAAHLNDPVATQMSLCGVPGLKCSCGGLRACVRCKGTGTQPLPTDLVPFVRSAQVPADVLREWVCDCAEHVVVTLASEEDRDHLLQRIAVSRALSAELAHYADEHAGTRVNTLLREPTPASISVVRAVQLLVNASNLQRRLENHERWRTAFAGVVTMAYRAAGNTQAERGWQVQALVRRLLG